MRVWVLGANNPNADKCIQWDSEFPNFADADILIVNLDSLNSEILKRNSSKMKNAAQEIFEKSINGGELFFLTAPKMKSHSIDIPSNYILSPIVFETQVVSLGTKFEFAPTHKFSSYYKEVKNYNFYLYSPVVSEYALNSKATTAKMKIVTDWIAYSKGIGGSLGVQEESGLTVVDNVGRMLSGTFRVVYHDRSQVLDNKYVKCVGGIINYLPLLDGTTSTDESIDIILNILGKSTSKESFPQWVTDVNIEGMGLLNKNMLDLQNNVANLELKIKNLQQKKENLMTYYRLLFSKGNQLLLAVKESFKLLGINEIDNPRGDEFEDLRFDLKTIKGYKYCVIEVHGTENRTTLKKLRQCHQYVEDYFDQTDEHVKGVYVVNQQRLLPYPKELTERIFFEDRQIQYCKQQNICVIPSTVLFESVNRTLKSKKKTRQSLEKTIVECIGVLAEL